jgi:NTP pyrophosphatase (non-canonical NTP hydrolase)
MPDRNAEVLSASLLTLGVQIQETKVAKGWSITTPKAWGDPYEIPAVLALIHSEVSEALEAFRKAQPENFAEELADVVIRVVGLAHGLNIDLGKEIAAKTEKNKQREFRHGGKKL